VIDAAMRLSATIRTAEDIEHAQKERAKLDAAFNDLDKKVKCDSDAGTHGCPATAVSCH